MSDVQIDMLAWAAFLLPNIAYLITRRPLSRKENAYYEHFASQSAWFPRGRWRVIYPLVWWPLIILQGVSLYFFWHDTDTSTAVNTSYYVGGIVFHWIQLLCSFAWLDSFFNQRMPRWVSFINILVIDLCVIGHLVCAAVLHDVMSIVVFSLLATWLVYATFLTILTTFVIPAPKGSAGEGQYSPLPSAPPDVDMTPVYAQSPIQQQLPSPATTLRDLRHLQQHLVTRTGGSGSSNGVSFNPSLLRLPGK